MSKERTYLTATGSIKETPGGLGETKSQGAVDSFEPIIKIQRMNEEGVVIGPAMKILAGACSSAEKAEKSLERHLDTLALPTPQAAVSRCADVDLDEDEDIDYEEAADDLLNWVPDGDHGVEVFDGFNIHDLSDFASLSPETIHHLINYIEDQQLQDEAPWSIVYHLWKCLEARNT